MIAVSLRLVSANGPARDRHLGQVAISNDGTGAAGRGHYNVRAYNGSSSKPLLARVENFPRKSRSALELLRRALNALADKGALP